MSADSGFDLSAITSQTVRLLRRPQSVIALIIIITILLNFLLVFGYSDYRNYLSTDMLGY